MEDKKRILIELLKQSIIDTDKMFDDDTHSPAYIIGYLKGVIKAVIEELKE
jgi:hypothetical protein